jgi:uncharacterized protein (TIGR02117 family)
MKLRLLPQKAGLLAALLFALSACAARPPVAEPPEGAPAVSIYLVAHSWHTGIAVRRTRIPAGLWPEIRDFPQADYLEVGWGDREFYQRPDPGLWTMLRAALTPTASVLHVVGVRGPLAGNFPASEIVELSISEEGLVRLARYIHDAHERGGAPVAAPLGPGLYGDSRFYPAWETFHLFRTCNVWTARALRAAGLPVDDSITMSGLMAQARELGRVVNRPLR